jgi:AcrR family transcriptional regulator
VRDERVSSPGSGATDGRTRILAGTLACLREGGISGFSLQRASQHAGLSKALLLYHFSTREALLAALVEWLTHRVTSRERSALERSPGVRVLDGLWEYLADEHERGEYQVLLSLIGSGPLDGGEAATRSVEQRRSHAARTIEEVYSRLRLAPRLPLPQLTEVEQAFREGLLARMARGVTPHARAAFDVFWLALLNQSA